jgi:hypothetical protein
MNRKFLIIGVILFSGIFLITSCSPRITINSPSDTDTGKTTTPLKLPPSSYLSEIPRISVEEVKAKLDADTNIIIIDSRSAKSYQKSHIAGAISLPFSTERPLGDMVEPYSGADTRLSNYDEIITYCT